MARFIEIDGKAHWDSRTGIRDTMEFARSLARGEIVQALKERTKILENAEREIAWKREVEERTAENTNWGSF